MSRWRWIAGGLIGIATLTSSASGQQYFALSGDGVLYEGDVESGELIEIGDTGIGGDGPFFARSIEFTQDGRLIVIGEDIPGTVFVIDPDSAEATAFLRPDDDSLNGALVTTMASARNQVLYIYSGFPRRLIAYDETTGEYLFESPTDHSDQVPPSGIGPVHAMVEREDGRLLFATSRILNLGNGFKQYYSFWSLNVDNDMIEPLPADPTLTHDAMQAYLGVYRGDTFFSRRLPTEDTGHSIVQIEHLDPISGELSAHAELQFPFSILGFQIVPENPADRALPYGDLDVSDAITFLVSFSNEETEADLAAPFGVYDFDDVIGFLRAFQRGYP